MNNSSLVDILLFVILRVIHFPLTSLKSVVIINNLL